MLVEAVVDYAIYMLDPTGRVTNWNTGAERIKGYTADEIIGSHFSRFYTDEDRAAGVPVFALRCAAETGRFEAEGWRVRKDGSRFWAMVVIDAIRDPSGRLLGFAKVTRDMTERREAQQRLEETRAQLFQAQKMEALGQLTSGLAHDFNNLLTVMLAGAEMAKRQAGGASKLTALLEAIEGAAQRGASLTRQLLAFARRQPLQPKLFQLTEHMDGVIQLMRHSLPDNILVETDIPPEPLYVEVDEGQLDLALLNLAVNAKDAMSQGGVLTVKVGKAVLDNQVEGLSGEFAYITVADTGPGVPPEILDRVFEPFFTTKEVGKGTGLGLSQAYGFARQSRGSLTIASRPGEGATVTVHLPLRRAPEAVAAVRAAPRPRLTNARVLVVEDDPVVAALAAELILEMGHRPEIVSDAAQALSALEKGDHDVVFSDVMMAGEIDGLELARIARERNPELKILLATGYSEAAAAGGMDFPLIAKPYGPKELVAAFTSLLDEQEAQPASA